MTSFDLASLAEPIATATSIHRLIEQGKLELDHDDTSRDFAASGEEGITIRRSSTRAASSQNPIAEYALGPQKWENLIAIKPFSPLGKSSNTRTSIF
ncbi:MAG: hypothetical protein QM811_07525 [Pirellulales bacterium]